MATLVKNELIKLLVKKRILITILLLLLFIVLSALMAPWRIQYN